VKVNLLMDRLIQAEQIAAPGLFSRMIAKMRGQ
jgi:hypothetical protein